MRSRHGAGEVVLLAAVALLVLPVAAQAKGRCGDPASRPWCDTSLGPDRRAELLLAELTPDERISLLAGDDLFGVVGGEGTHTGTSEGVPRVGLPTIYLSDGPVGVRSGKATAMPVPVAVAATFDARTASLHGRTIADEVRNKGNDIVFAPTIEPVRTPLAGRTFETYGEDAYLSARMAVAWIRAAQKTGVISTVKHFAPNSQEGTGPLANQARPGMTLQALGLYATAGSRLRVNVRADDRTLRELYLAPFEAAVREARVGTVMCAYNKLRGTYACENRALLEKILRDDWGFRGFTVADYVAAHSTERSLTSGLDFEPWPGLAYSPALVTAALLNGGVIGGVTRADVDLHVFRYLRTLFAHGALDRAAFPADESRIDREAHAAAARKIAERGAVLLRNRDLLPLRPRRLESIAVIGPGATRYVTGGGSSEIDPYSFVTPLEAIKRRAGAAVEVRHDDGIDPVAAADLARSSDVAIVFAPDFETEGVDRACLTLECPPVYGDLDALIDTIAVANPDTVVVLETGAPVLTPWRGRVAAVLEAWYPGSRGGPAIARVLFGDVDPSGRLPLTFPREASDIPTAGDPAAYPGIADNVVFSEGILTGYRHYDENRIKPAYPFGHGLSYARMRFSGLRVRRLGAASRKAIPGRGAPLARVSVRIENTSRRRGIAVPQLYVGLPSRPWADQPPRQLRGSRRLALAPGAARRVGFTLYRRDLSAWDAERHRWRLVRGCHQIAVGKSSRRLPVSAGLSVGGRCP